MTSNFWTTQNIAILSAGLMAVPTGAGAGLYLLKKSETPDPTKVASAPAINTAAQIPAPPIPQSSSTPTSVPTATVAPSTPAQTVVTSIPVKPTVATPAKDEAEVKRLMTRIDGATPDGALFQMRNTIRDAFPNADAVEQIHTVNFGAGNLSLGQKDEAYLASALRSNEALERYETDTNAMLVVLGYASKDGSSKNNRYALTRAENVREALLETVGYDIPVRTWAVGETDILSKEVNSDEGYHNCAAEVWLVVDRNRTFNQVWPDNFPKFESSKSSSKSWSAPAKKSSTTSTVKKSSSHSYKKKKKSHSHSSLHRHLVKKLSGGCH